MIKKAFILFCCLLFTSSVCYGENPQLIKKSLSNHSAQKYLVQLPKNYSSEAKFPLFIAIHWLQGTALQQVSEWKFLTNKAGYILLCPDFADGYQTFRGQEDKKLIQIIEEVKKDFSIDESKIFIVGFSGGAQFAHRFALKYPEEVRAACVLSAGDYDRPRQLSETSRVKYFVAVGEEDERYGKTKDFYRQLKSLGFDAIFQSFPGVGHILHSSIKEAVMDFLRDLE